MVKLKSENVLLKNMISLMGSQAINFILPLITYPYIIHVVGLSHFGDVQFVLTVMTFLGLIIDYGYNYRAPREVALLKNDPKELASMVSRVLTYKILTFGLIALSLTLYALFFSPDKYLLYLGGLIFLLNFTITPNWFFQGIEKMEYIAIVDVGAKIVFTCLIFVFVREPQDYIFILPLWGLGGVVSTCVGVYIIRTKHKMKLSIPPLKTVINELVIGYPLFVSNLSMVILSNSQIIIIGILHGSVAVGLFSIAEKIVKIPWTITQVFSQVIYPKVCVLNSTGYKSVLHFYNRILPYFYGGVFLIMGCIWLFSSQIVGYFTAESIPEVVVILKVMLFSVIIILLNVPLQQYILANGMNTILMKILFVVSIINIVVSFIFIYFWSNIGAALSSNLTMLILFLFFAGTVRTTISKLALHE